MIVLNKTDLVAETGRWAGSGGGVRVYVCGGGQCAMVLSPTWCQRQVGGRVWGGGPRANGWWLIGPCCAPRGWQPPHWLSIQAQQPLHRVLKFYEPC